MHKILIHLLLCPALIASFWAGTAAAAKRPEPAYRESELIVKYRDLHAAVPSKRAMGLVARRRLAAGRIELLQLPAMTTVADVLPLLMQDPAVEYAEPNFRRHKFEVTPNDPLFPLQWGLRNTGQANFVSDGDAGVPGADLNLIQAWDANGDGIADRTSDASVIVAVVDDSVELTHQDLAANLVAGFDFRDNDSDPSPTLVEDTHGTEVAGCIAAVGNNQLGVAGVAWNARLMPLRFDYDVASHVQALEYARDHGARIVNASFGGPGYSQAELEAIRDLAAHDILYVASAGNDDSNTDRAQISYPANYDADNIVSVASISRQGQITSFSQYGPLSIDVAAPGLQIITTAVGNSYTSPNGFGISGTSFSAPYVAGVAALIRSQWPAADYREVKARLIESGQNGDNARALTSGGRVDADLALEMSPRPSLVIESVTVDSSGNGVLDPGETTTLRVVVRNLWRDARNVQISASAGNGVVIGNGPIVLGHLAQNQRATAEFSVQVPANLTGHHYERFVFALNADGYQTTRQYLDEIAQLPFNQTIDSGFAGNDVDLYDEYHAWHLDLNSRARFLVIESEASADVDLLVKRRTPPQYNITVGTNPEDEGFYCTSGTADNCQDAQTYTGFDTQTGMERICIENPANGTYHIVAVNFAQLDGPLPYRLRAYRSNTCGGVALPPPTSSSGGGAPGLSWLLGLAALAALKTCARALQKSRRMAV